jgi:hypothetical protein
MAKATMQLGSSHSGRQAGLAKGLGPFGLLSQGRRAGTVPHRPADDFTGRFWPAGSEGMGKVGSEKGVNEQLLGEREWVGGAFQSSGVACSRVV